MYQQKDMCELLICVKASDIFKNLNKKEISFKTYVSGASLIDGTYCGANKVR